MISYKRDVSERQSLSEVKMGRGSPICERVHRILWDTLKNNVPQFQRLCKSHLQCITSSLKRLRETGEISVRKRQDPSLDACGLRPSDDTASLIGMITSLILLRTPLLKDSLWKGFSNIKGQARQNVNLTIY